MRKGIKILLWLVAFFLIFNGIKTAYYQILDEYFPIRYEEEIKKYAEKEGLSPLLVTAVINAESGFDEAAHSGVAKGLMQITDSTAKWICEKTGETYKEDMAYDPETCIRLGCWYLGYLVDRYQNTDTAIAAYNAGHGNVDTWLLDKRYSTDGKTLWNIPFPETEKYVPRVRWIMWVYEKAY